MGKEQGQGGQQALKKPTKVFEEVGKRATDQFAEWCRKYAFSDWKGIDTLLTASSADIAVCFTAGGFALAAQETIANVVNPLVANDQIPQVTDAAKQELGAIFDGVKTSIANEATEKERQKKEESEKTKKASAEQGTVAIQTTITALFNKEPVSSVPIINGFNDWLSSLNPEQQEDFRTKMKGLLEEAATQTIRMFGDQSVFGDNAKKTEYAEVIGMIRREG